MLQASMPHPPPRSQLISTRLPTPLARIRSGSANHSHGESPKVSTGRFPCRNKEVNSIDNDCCAYSCYNAFSRLDMRVDVKIPGSVEAYAVDERGERRACTDQMWLETYLCSVLRAFSFAEEPLNKIIALRKFNPITSTEVEHRFLDAAERLFFKGWQLGSDPEVQVPNVVSNHLTTGLLRYIHTTGRFTSGINLFEKLRTKEPEIASLLARVLIDADEEVRAVQLLYDTVKLLPMESSLLDVQAEFCMSKGRYDLALECAKRAVNSAPSEFTTWERLAQVYLKLEQYELVGLYSIIVTVANTCRLY